MPKPPPYPGCDYCDKKSKDWDATTHAPSHEDMETEHVKHNHGVHGGPPAP